MGQFVLGFKPNQYSPRVLPKVTTIKNFLRLLMVFLLVQTVASLGCSSERRTDLLSPVEREWLTAHDGKIRYALNPDYPPFGFYDQNGVSRGLTADYFKLLERKLHFRFKEVKVASWNEIIIKAKNREIDVFGNADDMPERRQYLLFTEPYYEAAIVILVRSDKKGYNSIAKLQGILDRYS